MRFICAILFLLGITTFGHAEEDELLPVPSVRMLPKEIPSTSSPDKQFRVYGRDARMRSSVFHVADETRDELMLALAQKTRRGTINPRKGELPIIIQLIDRFETGAKAIRGEITVMPDDTISIQIKIAAGGGIDRERLREEFVRWFLVDLMMRRVRPESLDSNVRLELPDWLHQGALELIKYHQEGRPSDVFATVFKLGKTLTVQEIINADITGLDAVSLNIYRVSSCALLLMLLEQPEGVDHLLKCIGDMPANQGSMTDHLEKHFPVLHGTGNQLEKWWSLAMATSAEPTQSELLSMIDSEKELAKLMVFRCPELSIAAKTEKPKTASKLLNVFKKSGGKKETPDAQAAAAPEAAKPTVVQAMEVPIEEYIRVKGRPDSAAIFKGKIAELTRLSFRVHPFYRQMLTDYQEQFAKINAGKDRNAAEVLQSLAKRREVMLKEAKAVEDHLDWFEATQRTQPSGKFQDFLRVADNAGQPAKPRTDPITRYMDAMEKEYR